MFSLAKLVEIEQHERVLTRDNYKTRGYFFGLNDCQTTATQFWNYIRCSDATHGHPPATVPTQGRDIIVSAGNAASIVDQNGMGGWWPFWNYLVLDPMLHVIVNAAPHLVDWIHHIPMLVSDVATGDVSSGSAVLPGLNTAIDPLYLGTVLVAAGYGSMVWKRLQSKP